MTEVKISTNTPLQLGEKLSNGGIVIDFTWREYHDDEEPGQHGIVLCMLPGNFDPYVTWRFFRRKSDGVVVCIHGVYVVNLVTALKDYEKRSKNI